MCEQCAAGAVDAFIRWYMRQAKLLPVVVVALYVGTGLKPAH